MTEKGTSSRVLRSVAGKDLRIEIFQSLDQLQHYAAEWNYLALDTPQKVPTLSYAWVSSYFEHLMSSGETWRCLMAFDGEDLVGILPIVIMQHKIMGLNRPRIRTPHNKHSFSVDFLVARGREYEVIPPLFSAILNLQPNIFEFSLNRLPENSRTLAVLGNSTDRAVIVKEFDGMGSYLPIIGSMDDFRKSLSRNFSRNLVKARNKLNRLSEVRTVFLFGSEATEKEVQRFTKVEASGWKKDSGTAIELSPNLISFYTSLARKLGESGWLEWHFLEAEGQTIAGQLAIRMGRSLIILKIGYDEKYSFCSPGNILFEKTIERAYNNKDTDEINCITDMPWHDNWGMSKRDHYNLWIYPRRPFPLIFGALKIKAKIGIRKLPFFFPTYRRIRDMVNKGQ